MEYTTASLRDGTEEAGTGLSRGTGPGESGTVRPDAGGPGALREDLLDLLQQREVRQRMNEALLREATGESKSTGVIRAYELVQKILQEAGEDAPAEELDLRRFSDRELRNMIARIRRTTARETGKETDEETETRKETGKETGKAHRKTPAKRKKAAEPAVSASHAETGEEIGGEENGPAVSP
ncbi:MAG: hypothetical protein IJT94_02620 [Oscillibacter sp.]|nr:hypothetical protein [Oscillibacter sp.]